MAPGAARVHRRGREKSVARREAHRVDAKPQHAEGGASRTAAAAAARAAVASLAALAAHRAAPQVRQPAEAAAAAQAPGAAEAAARRRCRLALAGIGCPRGWAALAPWWSRRR